MAQTKPSPKRDAEARGKAVAPFTLTHHVGGGDAGAADAGVLPRGRRSSGKTFVSPDATAPAGFVRIGEQSLWQEHVYPLWNPYVFLGMPSFGSGAYNPLIYPPDWPLALLAEGRARCPR